MNDRLSGDDELCRGFSIWLHRRDFRVLRAGSWLKDEVSHSRNVMSTLHSCCRIHFLF